MHSLSTCGQAVLPSLHLLIHISTGINTSTMTFCFLYYYKKIIYFPINFQEALHDENCH
jgi:hypothetical protein